MISLKVNPQSGDDTVDRDEDIFVAADDIATGVHALRVVGVAAARRPQPPKGITV